MSPRISEALREVSVILSQSSEAKPSQVKTHVLYFAQLREMMGKSEEDLQIHEGMTLGELLAILVARDSRFRGLADSIVFFLNEERADGDAVLRDGDVVALCPPVSGG